MEGLNDEVGNVYVLPQHSEVEGAPKQRHLHDGSHEAYPSHQQTAEEEFPRIEEDNEDQSFMSFVAMFLSTVLQKIAMTWVV